MFARAAPVIFVVLWGTGFVGARLGMPYSEPGTFLAIRFAIACILLCAIAAILRAPWPGRRLAFHAIIIGALIHGIYLGSVFWAVDHGMPAGVSAVIVGLQPLLTAMLAGLFLGETISRGHIIGLGIGLLGVVLVLAPKLDITDSGITAATIAVSFMGMVSVTIGTIYQKQVGSGVDLRSGTALQYLGGFTPVFILALFTETGQIVWSAEMIVAMVWAIFVLSFGAVFLLLWLIRQGSVAKVSTLLFLVPAVAALMEYAWFGATLIPLQLFGMALCAVAVALATKGPSTGQNASVGQSARK